MAVIDATNTLAQAHAQAIDLAAPTDESLNAGAFLPDEPVPDVLTQTVYADADTVMSMLPELEKAAVQAEVTTESIGVALHYLHRDLLAQRGMSQKIATEALQLLPNFGQGRPVNYYSRLPSATGYTMALEEISDGINTDLMGQLATIAMRLENVACNPGTDQVIATLDFKRRADQVAMQAEILKDFIGKAVENGFTWDDACFQGCAVDPSQNAVVPSILQVDRKWPNFMASMDEYYQVHQDAPAMMELMTTHLNHWKISFTFALDALKGDAAGIQTDLPKAPTVYFGFGSKTTSIENIADVFTSAEDKLQEPSQNRDTLTWVKDIGNGAQQARVDDILGRAKSFATVSCELAAVLKDIAAQLGQAEAQMGAAKDLGQMVQAFDRAHQGMGNAFNQIIRWCVNAGLATSFAGVLADRVVEHAWTSINQCRETMQMKESAYLALKTMVQDIQAPVRTNVL